MGGTPRARAPPRLRLPAPSLSLSARAPGSLDLESRVRALNRDNARVTATAQCSSELFSAAGLPCTRPRNLQRPTHTPNLRARSASHSHARCAPRRSQPAPETAAAPPCRPPERRPPPRPGHGILGRGAQPGHGHGLLGRPMR